MISILVGGLAAGAITVLLCTSHAGRWFRQTMSLFKFTDQLANCCFCMSWWISIAMLDKFSLSQWAATVAVANITVLLIHMSMSTVEEDDDAVVS